MLQVLRRIRVPRPSKSEWVLIAVIIIIFSVLIFAVAKREASKSTYYKELCEAMSMKSVSTSESNGKTSVTSRFCVDDQQRVYWPKGK